MTSYQISNPNNLNYISNNTNNNIISPKRVSKSPLIYHNNRINYGEKVQEKNNYILYVSGSGHRPRYERRQKGKKYHNQINLQKNLNYNLYEEEIDNNILSSSDNYKYKETKNIKMNNPQYEIVTIHKRLGSPRQSQVINSPKKNKKIKIKKVENKNEKIRILRENKSSDYFRPIKKIKYIEEFHPQNDSEIIQEIIQNDDNNDYIEYNDNNNKIINEDSQIETTKDGDYFIKITKKRKELQPYNYNKRNVKYINKNGKLIKVIRYNEPLYTDEDNYKISNKNYLKRNNYEKEPYYIGNYGEEDENFVSSIKYNKNNNDKRENEEYEQEEQDDNEYQNQKYINMEDENEYVNNNIYNQEDQENEYLDDIKGIKDIVCPLHGKISIIIHKNPFNKN